MDNKNTVIGFTLIFLLLIGMNYFNRPSEAEMERQEFVRDSIRTEQLRVDSLKQLGITPAEEAKKVEQEEVKQLPDSLRQMAMTGKYGVFAPAGIGEEQEVILENDKMKITFSTKGARIVNVDLKGYKKWVNENLDNYYKEQLNVLADPKNKFEYRLPVNSAESKEVYTSDLYFVPTMSGNTVSFKADAGNGRYLEQKFTVEDGSYMVDYDLNFVGLNDVIDRNAESIELKWINYLNKLEKDASAYSEKNLSTVYFRETDEDPNWCSCNGDDEEESEKSVHWVANAQQFFNSTLIAKEGKFKSAAVSTEMLDADNEIKKLTSEITLPYNHAPNESFAMKMYIGPNDYKLLKSYDIDFEQIIPFGWSIFGWINRNLFRPLFSFLAGFIPNYGLVIFALTLIVKLILFPLTYKMLYSQAKMGALKPRIAKLKEKHGDDAQKLQMAQMNLYRETGVSPLGGCMPMILQMPIWFALYRFFPASIEFRQKSFLWADDLSSWDSIMSLPFEIPMYGAHVSLFTLLWAGTTLIYTYYNSKHMDFSAQPMMKYMQYAMPLFFIVFFNSFASGLCCYLFFSNIINIAQTIITKEVVIDKKKIEAEIEKNKKKPKKKGAFAQSLEKALKEQKAKTAKLEADKKKKAKKK